MYDAVIIGAGITGTMVARDLSRFQLKLALIDRENDIACGATMANSAIVHTGYDPEPGTMKARMNVRGAQMYEQICRDLGCKYKVLGSWMVAIGEEEEAHLEIMRGRAEARGIPYEIMSGDEARAIEKNLSDDITKVLAFPTTAVIYPWEVATACTEVAVNNGMELHLNSEVKAIRREGDHYVVVTDHDEFETAFVINCAGVCADLITGMVCEDPGYHMTPRKGEYYVLDNDTNFVNHIIFPVPSARGKGVLAVPTVYGNVLLGPNSDHIDDREDIGSSVQGLDYVRKNITKTMKNVPFYKSIRNFAGLRPSSSSRDFIIREREDAPHFIEAASIESPGLASAPAISEYIVNELLKGRLEMKENPEAVMTRERPLVLSELSEEERNEKIRQNPLYGKIICRCEQISEGEIVDCIHRTCGATTVKGVKKRVRPGMGRCQGGFCEPLVVEILARELNRSPLEIVLDSEKSRILDKENR